MDKEKYTFHVDMSGRIYQNKTIGIALVGFLWGVAKFILAAEDTSKREEGRNLMLYGIIALFVMISIWGLVTILAGTFGIDTSIVPRFPGIR